MIESSPMQRLDLDFNFNDLDSTKAAIITSWNDNPSVRITSRLDFEFMTLTFYQLWLWKIEKMS
ncbi:hypothetical protein BpHYR1_050262 [Brachionus plicatilis]|uniref:Uncharacterized protein n=1 Tax=Brachionus plicatilis TaxID=10195 RepID=A0A3M7RV96_BRAPC|nr:hypothetical protein BpHYR1_050262 [Brachionus plicatilis]